MKKISRSALLGFKPEQIYKVVNEVEFYPEFLPWCGSSEVLEVSETEQKASVTIEKLGIKQKFTTHNFMQPNREIKLTLVDGPFSHLEGLWSFEPIGDSACRINFDIEFKVANSLMGIALGKLFEQIANTLVDSFVKRAQDLYGR